MGADQKRIKKISKRLIPFAVLLIAVILAISYFLQTSGVAVGEAAPDFTLSDSSGRTVSLSDFSGQTVLLNFWATWCPPCVAEMPSLERLYHQLQPENFTVLAVSVDEDGWGPVQAFGKRFGLSFPIVLDLKADVASRYGVFQLPESYLIDPDGTVVKEYQGPREWDQPEIVGELLGVIRQP